MDIDLEREAFEKWAVDVLPPFKLSTITGLYSPDYVNSIFAGWQARAAMPLVIPEGYALVPVEPTKDMLIACEDAGSIYNHQRGRRIYQAMLQASPVVTP